ncbi:hypothetical protein [Streptomyces sp. NPDC007070]|uniref:hypothetical protein n=1 Tax=Streptomyces sp. NPDC007070 TaxID=3154312 RepID=UPI0033EFEB51
MTATDLTSPSGNPPDAKTPPAAGEPTGPPRPEGRPGAALIGATVGAGVLLVAAGTLIGAWFMPFVFALVLGVLGRISGARRRLRVTAAALAAVLGWGLALVWLFLGDAPVGAVAVTTAALAGLPPLAAVTVAATLLVALVQSLVGVWLGRTLTPTPKARTTRPATPDEEPDGSSGASPAPADDMDPRLPEGDA